MRKTLSFIIILVLLISCNKIKERKFTGVYHGTLIMIYEGYEYPTNNYIEEYYETKRSYEVFRQGVKLYVEEYESYPFSLEDMSKEGGKVSYGGGGGKYYELQLSMDQMSISFSQYQEGPYPVSIKKEFLGYKQDN